MWLWLRLGGERRLDGVGSRCAVKARQAQASNMTALVTCAANSLMPFLAAQLECGNLRDLDCGTDRHLAR